MSAHISCASVEAGSEFSNGVKRVLGGVAGQVAGDLGPTRGKGGKGAPWSGRLAESPHPPGLPLKCLLQTQFISEPFTSFVKRLLSRR